MSDISKAPIITDLGVDDHIIVIVDGCVRRITKADFIKDVYLGGFSICASWLNCVRGIGVFTGEIPTVNNPPIMGNIAVHLEGGTQDYIFPSDAFINQYYDEEGDAFGKIIIVGGDLSGYSINGNPLYIGQVLIASELSQITYDTKNTTSAYLQEWFFETYDENNIQAISQ